MCFGALIWINFYGYDCRFVCFVCFHYSRQVIDPDPLQTFLVFFLSQPPRHAECVKLLGARALTHTHADDADRKLLVNKEIH